MKSRDEVVTGVSEQIDWWISQRLHKLSHALLETMSLNPFLAPILFELHDAQDFTQLGELLVAGHLMVGHSTGFGKLIDEKILPNVFGTTKLTKKFRDENPPYNQSSFDEIDHIVYVSGRNPALLSLKAGRWTIQLSMAVQLNKAFTDILKFYKHMHDEIVVGVFYGQESTLTDKYRILRGIKATTDHDVVDVTPNVNVAAGREFWAWINDGEQRTQDWVMEGILKAVVGNVNRQEFSDSLRNFKQSFEDLYRSFVAKDGAVDWNGLLESING